MWRARVHTRRAGDEDVVVVSLVRCPGLGLGLLGLAGHVAVDNIRHGKKLISADAVKLSVNNCCKKVKVAFFSCLQKGCARSARGA